MPQNEFISGELVTHLYGLGDNTVVLTVRGERDQGCLELASCSDYTDFCCL